MTKLSSLVCGAFENHTAYEYHALRRGGKGWFGVFDISFSGGPHCTRHVPGVIKHDAVVISPRVYHHSQLPCDLFTAFLIFRRFALFRAESRVDRHQTLH